MTLSAWVWGSLLLAGLGAAALAAGRAVRRRALPAWDGAAAWLADLVLALAIVLGTAQALGAVGLFRRVTVTVAVLAVAAALVLATRRQSQPVAPAPPQGDVAVDPPPRPWQHASIGAVAVVVAQWASVTAQNLRVGILNSDSIWYHLPRAARFADTGWITPLHHTAPEFPDAFHPSNAELVQALPMLMYQRDALAPLVNLAWVPLVLLAGWCIGRPWGRGAVSLTGVAALLASPLLVVEGAGNAGNDLMAVFFLLAAVALLLQPDAGRAPVVIAGVAAGLALSTKLTVVPAVAVLTVGVVWAAARNERTRRAVAWLVPLLLFGAYWYVRNLVTVGSPVPSTNLPLFGERSFRIADELGFSVADYLTDGDVWRDWFLPGLRYDFGWTWPLLGAAFVVAVAGALGQRGDRLVQTLGVLLPVSAVAYVVLPTTALGERGEPLLFAANVVYVVPALVVAIALLPVLRRLRSPRAAWVLVAAYGLAAVVSPLTSSVDTIPDGQLDVALAAGALTVLAGLVVVHRPPSRRVSIGAGLGVVALAAVAGLVVSDRYLDDRYADVPFYRWANDLTGARVAIAGFGGQFPFYGSQLDNTVEYVGDVRSNGEFHDLERCEPWRRALREGTFDHVVLREERSDITGPLEWTTTDPAATLVAETGGGHIFRFAPDVDDPGCP